MKTPKSLTKMLTCQHCKEKATHEVSSLPGGAMYWLCEACKDKQLRSMTFGSAVRLQTIYPELEK